MACKGSGVRISYSPPILKKRNDLALFSISDDTRRMSVLLLALILGIPAPSPQPPVSFFVSHGRTLAYQTYGAGKVTWILLAGGPGYEPRYMDAAARMLASNTRRIVLLNQRGTGLSKAAGTDSPRLTVNGAISDLEALRVALRLNTVRLIGHSWGGYLAMAYASQHSKRVRAMVLLDSLGDDVRSWLPVTDEMMAALTPEERRNASLVCTSLKPSDACDIADLPSFFFDRHNVAAFIQSIDPTGPQIDNELINDAVTLDIMRRPHLALLSGSRIPALVVFGQADPYRHPAQHDITALLAQAQIVIIPRAGHFTWFEQPAIFSRTVIPFLNAH